MRLALPAILAALVATPALAAGARQAGTVIMPTDPAQLQVQEEWGFADAVIAGDTVYMSGVVVGVRPKETDLNAAFTRAFERMGDILKRAGASWDDVVDMTSYHTDMTTQLPAMTAVKKKYLTAPPPAWTAIGISRLAPDRGIAEIKLVAKLPAKR